MPVVPAISYPGVYIQEVPTGSHTIVGVATSITAFIGRTLRGPVNAPMITTSYADFEQTFGGSWSQSYLPDAVRDFYMNGGAQAVIVRLYHPSGQDTPPPMPPTPTVIVTEVPNTGNQSQSADQSGSDASAQSPSRFNQCTGYDAANFACTHHLDDQCRPDCWRPDIGIP